MTRKIVLYLNDRVNSAYVCMCVCVCVCVCVYSCYREGIGSVSHCIAVHFILIESSREYVGKRGSIKNQKSKFRLSQEGTVDAFVTEQCVVLCHTFNSM